MSKINLLFVLIIVILTATSCSAPKLCLGNPFQIQDETWLGYPDSRCYKGFVYAGVKQYKLENIDHTRWLQTYTAFNDYLNYSNTRSYPEDKFQFDEQGLPLKRYSNGYHYNPITIADFGLVQYGKYLNTQDGTTLSLFYTVAEKLITMQDAKGALRYPFEYTYYLTGETFEKGWVSGMAQNQALSVYARAYHLSNDEKYLNAGNSALSFMLTPIENGGTLDSLKDIHLSLHNYPFIQEYIVNPGSFTLNGYMFILLGLYDWWQVKPDEVEGSHAIARDYFTKGIVVLEKILPYYDIGGFSSYDLGFITHKQNPKILPSYHAGHIYLLHALASITNSQVLKDYENLWSSYIQ